MIVNLKNLGKRCKQYRVDNGYLQLDVAKDTGYSTENVSAFETGRNDNATILLWYFAHGMKYEHLIGEVNYGKNI